MYARSRYLGLQCPIIIKTQMVSPQTCIAADYCFHLSGTHLHSIRTNGASKGSANISQSFGQLTCAAFVYTIKPRIWARSSVCRYGKGGGRKFNTNGLGAASGSLPSIYSQFTPFVLLSVLLQWMQYMRGILYASSGAGDRISSFAKAVGRSMI
jgi:hypothetical protein